MRTAARRRLRIWLATSYALVAGCTADDPGDGSTTEATGATEPVDLVDHYLWLEQGPADDPFLDHRPGAVLCNPLAVSVALAVDGPQLDVETADCNYLARTQPSLASISVGDVLRFEYRHFDLNAPDPAEAHVAIVVGDQVVYEDFKAIPGGVEPYPAATEEWEWVSDFDAAAGTPITLHLHNHGQNSWIIGALRRTR